MIRDVLLGNDSSRKKEKAINQNVNLLKDLKAAQLYGYLN
jgi:hypothetical protein